MSGKAFRIALVLGAAMAIAPAGFTASAAQPAIAKSDNGKGHGKGHGNGGDKSREAHPPGHENGHGHGANGEGRGAAFRDGDQRELLRALVADALTDPEGREALNEQFIRPRLALVAGVIARAVERGELPGAVDPDLAAKAVTGTLIYHGLLLDEVVDDALVERLLNLLFAAQPKGSGAT